MEVYSFFPSLIHASPMHGFNVQLEIASTATKQEKQQAKSLCKERCHSDYQSLCLPIQPTSSVLKENSQAFSLTPLYNRISERQSPLCADSLRVNGIKGFKVRTNWIQISSMQPYARFTSGSLHSSYWWNGSLQRTAS